MITQIGPIIDSGSLIQFSSWSGTEYVATTRSQQRADLLICGLEVQMPKDNVIELPKPNKSTETIEGNLIKAQRPKEAKIKPK